MCVADTVIIFYSSRIHICYTCGNAGYRAAHKYLHPPTPVQNSFNIFFFSHFLSCPQATTKMTIPTTTTTTTKTISRIKSRIRTTPTAIIPSLNNRNHYKNTWTPSLKIPKNAHFPESNVAACQEHSTVPNVPDFWSIVINGQFPYKPVKWSCHSIWISS